VVREPSHRTCRIRASASATSGATPQRSIEFRQIHWLAAARWSDGDVGWSKLIDGDEPIE
jgi:hypothetical protein